VFLLGIAASLVGVPAEISRAHVASIAFLAAHSLIAEGLVIGIVMQLQSCGICGPGGELDVPQVHACIPAWS
jgi:hypothetical protein